MITIRPAAARGHTKIGWLDSHHTFSFGDYVDPEHMGFRTLRVINEDRVRPAQGFGTHHHRDMEIISVVLQGELRHRDSLGNGSTLRPGEVQRMTAGTGVEHSEINPSAKDEVHFLQIWIIPERRGLAPGYEQKLFAAPPRPGELTLVAARDGRAGAVTVHQDAEIYLGVMAAGTTVRHAFRPGRAGWLQVASGAVTLNGSRLLPGDGAAIEGESEVTIVATDAAQVLLFDLA